MLENIYHFDHGVLHICFWTLPAILVAIGMVVMILIHKRNQKKREEDFQKELAQEEGAVEEVAQPSAT